MIFNPLLTYAYIHNWKIGNKYIAEPYDRSSICFYYKVTSDFLSISANIPLFL